MSALNFNKVTLAGHLTTTPELKQTTTGISVCTFNLAINRRRSSSSAEQIADFITCQAWRQTAELICKYFKKGSALMITGSLQVRSWQDKDGNKRYATEVVADEAYFVDSKNESQIAPAAAPYVPDAYTAQPAENGISAAPAPTFEEVKSDDDDLPF